MLHCCPAHDLHQGQARAADDHSTALAGATALHSQLATLQQQLAETTASFSQEQQQLAQAAAEAAEARDVAEASVAQLAEQLQRQQQQHSRQLTALQVSWQSAVQLPPAKTLE